MKQSSPRIDVDLAELDQIIDEGLRAPLSASDGEKLKNALHALVEQASPRWRTTEKTHAVLEQPPGAETRPEKPATTNSKPAPAGHGRNSAARFPGAHRVVIAHPTLRHGDLCPECGAGKVYRQKQPKTLVRIVGRPPLEATRYEMERLRCNGCNQVFTAETPLEVGPEKYDATAAAMIAQLRYGSGVPFKRLERLESNVGVPLPAATQWGLVEREAERMRPALEELIRQAAQGEVAHNDDTGIRPGSSPPLPQTGAFRAPGSWPAVAARPPTAWVRSATARRTFGSEAAGPAHAASVLPPGSLRHASIR